MAYNSVRSRPAPPSGRQFTVANFAGGLCLAASPLVIADNQSPDMLNMWAVDSLLTTRPGQRVVCGSSQTTNHYKNVVTAQMLADPAYTSAHNGLASVSAQGSNIIVRQADNDNGVCIKFKAREGAPSRYLLRFDYRSIASDAYIRLRYKSGQGMDEGTLLREGNPQNGDDICSAVLDMQNGSGDAEGLLHINIYYTGAGVSAAGLEYILRSFALYDVSDYTGGGRLLSDADIVHYMAGNNINYSEKADLAEVPAADAEKSAVGGLYKAHNANRDILVIKLDPLGQTLNGFVLRSSAADISFMRARTFITGTGRGTRCRKKWRTWPREMKKASCLSSRSGFTSCAAAGITISSMTAERAGLYPGRSKRTYRT